MSQENRVTIYTDGACSGNPGPGGWGVIMRFGEHERELKGGEAETTNNRMELLAVIVALEKLKTNDNEVHIYTDSKYVADAINQNCIYGWIKKGFRNVKNPDLWQRLIPLIEKHRPKFHWIRGHAGHPENEICDKLAVAACSLPVLQIDQGFENLSSGGLF